MKLKGLKKFFGTKKIVLKSSRSEKPKSDGPSLHKVLQNSYHKKSKQSTSLANEGYVFDSDLSNHNQQVYYHPDKKKLLYSVSGTHNLKDVGTDLYLAAGLLKKTNRYKEADTTYKKAREKYKPESSTVVGHSLGGSIASYVGKKEDKIITYNKGATIGQSNRKNETSIRTRGDPVSMFAKKDKELPFAFDAHNTNNLKKTSYSV